MERRRIVRHNAGIATTFRLRRLVAGAGIESIFPLVLKNLEVVGRMGRCGVPKVDPLSLVATLRWVVSEVKEDHHLGCQATVVSHVLLPARDWSQCVARDAVESSFLAAGTWGGTLDESWSSSQFISRMTEDALKQQFWLQLAVHGLHQQSGGLLIAMHHHVLRYSWANSATKCCCLPGSLCWAKLYLTTQYLLRFKLV